MAEDHGVSPLAILTEDWPARDVLILTFNANLGFFERAALSRVRARGARVTLVSDADMVHADPESVRYAGTTYLDGRAVCKAGGVFHPKLIVVAGQDQAAVLVGSGNASPGGWINNAELWTLLRATTEDGAPSTMHGIADFLEQLPEQVRFTPGIETVLTEVGAALRSFQTAEQGPNVVSTVKQRIIDQLPETDASTRLIIATPFHDRAATAVRQLHDRLNPASLEVLIQPETVFDGEHLAATLDDLGGAVATISDRRYHHGKLIEWETTDGIVNLTGSPNASSSALLRSMASGGNCELGLIGASSESLRPHTGDLDTPSTVAERPWVQPPESAGQVAVLLQAAVLEANGIRIILRRPLKEPADLQFLGAVAWEVVGTVPAGVETHLVPCSLAGSSALRLRDSEGAPSNVVWVADLERTGYRSVRAKRTIPGQAPRIALDTQFVAMVETALATVRSWAADSPSSASIPKAAPVVAAHTPQGWREYLESFRAEVGDDFGFFVLPHLMTKAGAEQPVEPDPDSPDGEAEGGTAEGIDDGSPDSVATIRLADPLDGEPEISPARLAAYRRMCERLTTGSEPVPASVLIAATTLSVGGAALGCWPDRGDLVAHLRRSLRALNRVAADPDLRDDAASIAAVALAILRAQVKQSGDDEENMLQRDLATREVTDLLVHATAEGVARRTAGRVGQVFGPVVSTERVMAMVAAVTAPDHFADAVDELMGSIGWSCEVHGTCIRINDPVAGDPVSAVLRAIGLAQDAPVVGATAAGPKGSAAAAWRSPMVVVVRRGPKARRITLYKLDGWFKPEYYAKSFGHVPSDLEQGNWYGDEVPPAVEDLLLEAGILLEEL